MDIIMDNLKQDKASKSVDLSDFDNQREWLL